MLFLALPSGAEWLVILAIIVLIFGAAKLPALARSSGQAVRIFRSEVKEDSAEEDKEV